MVLIKGSGGSKPRTVKIQPTTPVVTSSPAPSPEPPPPPVVTSSPAPSPEPPPPPVVTSSPAPSPEPPPDPADAIATTEEVDAQRSELEATQEMASDPFSAVANLNEEQEAAVDTAVEAQVIPVVETDTPASDPFSAVANLNEEQEAAVDTAVEAQVIPVMETEEAVVTFTNEQTMLELFQGDDPGNDLVTLSDMGLGVASDYIDKTYTEQVTQERIEEQEIATEIVSENLTYENLTGLRGMYNLNNPTEREAYLSFIDQALSSGELTPQQHLALRQAAVDTAVEDLNYDTLNILESTFDMDDPEQAEAYRVIHNQIIISSGETGFGVYTDVMTEEELAVYESGVEARKLEAIWGLSPAEQVAALADLGYNPDQAEQIIAQQDDMVNLVMEAGDLGITALAEAGALGVEVDIPPSATDIQTGLALLDEQGRIPEHYKPFLGDVATSVEATIQAQANVQFAINHSDQVSDDIVAELLDDAGVTEFSVDPLTNFRDQNLANWSSNELNRPNQGVTNTIEHLIAAIEEDPTAENIQWAIMSVEDLYGFATNDEGVQIIDEFHGLLLGLETDLVGIEAEAAEDKQFQLAQVGFDYVVDNYMENRGGVIARWASNLSGSEVSDSNNLDFIQERERELAALGILTAIPEGQRSDEQKRQIDLLISALTGVDVPSGIETGLGFDSQLELRTEQYQELTRDNTKNTIVFVAGGVGAVGGTLISKGNIGVGLKAGAALGGLAAGALLVTDDLTGSDYSVGDYVEVGGRSIVMGGIGGATGGATDKLLGAAPTVTRLLGVGLGEALVSENAMTVTDTLISSGGDFNAAIDELSINPLDVGIGLAPGSTVIGAGLFRNGRNVFRVGDDVTGLATDFANAVDFPPPGNLSPFSVDDVSGNANVVDALNGATRTGEFGGIPLTGPDPNARHIINYSSEDELQALEDALTNSGVRDLQPFSGGSESVVLASGENLVVRLQSGNVDRPNIPLVLQPIDSGTVGGTYYEVLPRIETNLTNPGSITQQDLDNLAGQLDELGYEFVDVTRNPDGSFVNGDGLDQLGRLPDGAVVVLDPHSIGLQSDPNILPSVDFPIGGTVDASNIGQVIDLDDGSTVLVIPNAQGEGLVISNTTFVEEGIPQFASSQLPNNDQRVLNQLLFNEGLTPNTIVYRTLDPQYVDLNTMTITGNPNSVAAILDPYNLIPNPLLQEGGQFFGVDPNDFPNVGMLRAEVPNRIAASDLGTPNLNVAINNPGTYSEEGFITVGIRLGDILEQGGRVYPDVGAAAELIRPFIVTVPDEVPFTIIAS